MHSKVRTHIYLCQINVRIQFVNTVLYKDWIEETELMQDKKTILWLKYLIVYLYIGMSSINGEYMLYNVFDYWMKTLYEGSAAGCHLYTTILWYTLHRWFYVGHILNVV